MLRTVSSSRLLARGFIRCKSSAIPDNAPTLLENEEWLGTLDDNAAMTHDANIESKNVIFDKHQTKNERFQIDIKSTPPDTKYIKVQSSLANLLLLTTCVNTINITTHKVTLWMSESFSAKVEMVEMAVSLSLGMPTEELDPPMVVMEVMEDPYTCKL